MCKIMVLHFCLFCGVRKTGREREILRRHAKRKKRKGREERKCGLRWIGRKGKGVEKKKEKRKKERLSIV